MPITTSTVIYTCATLTVQAVGESEVRSVVFVSGEAAEADMKAVGYRYICGVSEQVWSK